jgi:hypothetical protein
MALLLNIINSILGYNDAKGVVTNPNQKAFDWQRQYTSISMSNGTSDFNTIEPGGSVTLFDGTRNLPQALSAGSTYFSLTKLSASTSTYRLKITAGAGQFRTPRTTSFDQTTQIQMTINNNAIMTMEKTAGAGSFSNAQIGDVIRIRGNLTGDLTGNAFSAANSGYWVVIALNSSTKITVKRQAGQSFQGVTELVTIGATNTSDQLRIYSSSGVQTTDSFIIQGSLSSASFGNYDVAQVGPDFIDFISGQSLPDETGVMLSSVNDLIVYSNAKKLVYIEVDQNSSIRYNLDTSDNNIVTPIQAGNDVMSGYSNKWGFTWKCVVVNKSSINPLNVKWICAE